MAISGEKFWSSQPWQCIAYKLGVGRVNSLQTGINLSCKHCKFFGLEFFNSMGCREARRRATMTCSCSSLPLLVSTGDEDKLGDDESC
uniref:Uncharacterized protein MANES_09G158800 n=1 Tax=Rhizophora mucronata TaxID=61149 RepID=A0A2P2NTI0_RHIMU